jgi:predicted O-methyltransferase YrrM
VADTTRPDRGLFGAVERYIADEFGLNDAALAAALINARDAGLPDIEISAAQGRFLQILALTVGPTRILEIGTLGGYSTIWLARALPKDGRLISLEIDANRAEVARRSIANAGLESVVEVRVGPASEALRGMVAGGESAFDLFFIDADEPSYVDYLEAALTLSRPGTQIVADNIIREGEILNAATTNPRAIGARRFLEALANEPRVDATVVPIPGESSYDGMAIARVK